MRERMRVFVLAGIGALVIAGCAESRQPGGSVMGNTNWLTQCDEDGDCAAGLSCVCGVCTRECESSSDCDGLAGAACESGAQLASSGTAACETPSVPDVCLPMCSSQEECGSGYDCVGSRCLPVAEEPRAPSNVELGSQACGPAGAYASVNVQPDAECNVATEGNDELAIGFYDISSGFNGDSNGCAAPYRLNMLVHSCLNGEGDTLQIHSAEVRLTDSEGNMIVFDRLEPSLPNPFLVTTTGVVAPMEGSTPSRAIAVVEAIPTVYAKELGDFADQKVLAEIQIFGTTVGDTDIAFRELTYAIDICDGCLTIDFCSIPEGTPLDEIYGEGVCRDNASADGRFCIDYACRP